MFGARPVHYILQLVASPESTKQLTLRQLLLGLIDTFFFVTKNNLFRSKVNYHLLIQLARS